MKRSEELIYPMVQAGKFWIDDQGRVWRILRHKSRMRRAEHEATYLQVRSMVECNRVHALAHRLVWLHFNGPIPDGMTINHKDGNKHNNHPSNLELATYSDQIKHARSVLGKAGQAGAKNNNAVLTQETVNQIRTRRANGESLKSIAEDFDVSDRTISKVALGHRWTG